MAGLVDRTAARLDARLQRHADHPIALALSGGGDSLALLHLTADWARAHGRRLLAVTVDHGLNPDSSAWSRLCARAAASVGAAWTERRWTGPKPATGVPAAARAARHALIADAAREAGARVILFAHTADDIAEADWMRARGTALGRLREWSPSPAWPEGRGLMLLRPLLGERRPDLRNWLRVRGADWIEDPANENVRFARSRARYVLFQVGEGGPAEPGRMRVGRWASSHDLPSAFRAETPADASVRLGTLPLGGGIVVERSTAVPALGAALLCAAGTTAPPRADRLARLAERLRAGDRFTATLAGARIDAAGDAAALTRELGRRSPPTLALTAGVPSVWDGRYEITVAEPGWTVAPAAGRLNRLDDSDRAILRAVPPAARPTLPVLIRDGETAPLLAWRRAEVRALAPRRLTLAQAGVAGETTQEADLARPIHGETPPSDLFSS